MRIASHYKITEPLHEVMKRWTHREYLMRLHWLDEQWNKPDRSDHYLMRIAAEVRRVLAKNPQNIKEEDFIIEFKKEDPKVETEVSAEKRAAKSKAFWAPLLSIAEVRYKDGS